MALVVKNLPAIAGDIRDVGSIPGWERSPGEGLGNLLQYSCLENSTDRRAWWAAVPRMNPWVFSLAYPITTPHGPTVREPIVLIIAFHLRGISIPLGAALFHITHMN